MEQKLTDKLDFCQVEYQMNVSMKNKTWIHRGPTVPLFIIPKTKDELENVVRLLHDSGISYKLIGHTSNIYMLDTYKVGAIVATSKLTSYSFNDNTLCCDTGVNISKLSKECVEKGYEGFEGLIGLPGTIGAAVVNNASCFKCAPSKMLLSANILNIEGGTITKQSVTKEYFDFTHRSSSIKRHEKQAIVLDVTLQLKKTEEIDALKKLSQCNIQRRIDTQDGNAHNLGSVFSMKKPKPIGVMSLGIKKMPFVILYKIAEHFFRNNTCYITRRNTLLLWLYGYKDVIPYMSKKNINCFLWLDDAADNAFYRYLEFMNKCFDCGPLEIEILK